MYATRPAVVLLLATLVGGLAFRTRHDGDAGRAPETGRPGLDHGLRAGEVLDATGRLDAHVRPDRLPHEADVLDGRPAGGEASRGLHEVGARLLGELAGHDLLVVDEQAGLDDDLERGRGDGVPDRPDVQLDQLEVARLESTDVEDHVHFVCTLPDGEPSLERLGLRRVRAQREPDDRADLDVRTGQQVRAELDPRRVDADRSEPVFLGLGAELADLILRGVGFESCVVDEMCNVHESIPPVCWLENLTQLKTILQERERSQPNQNQITKTTPGETTLSSKRKRYRSYTHHQLLTNHQNL